MLDERIPYDEANYLDLKGLEPQRVKALSVSAHSERTEANEQKNSSLCFVVIGSLLVILGCLFLILSFYKRRNEIAGINFASVPFVACVACYVIGGIGLIYGLVKLTMSLIRIKKASEHIHELGMLYPKTGPKD